MLKVTSRCLSIFSCLLYQRLSFSPALIFNSLFNTINLQNTAVSGPRGLAVRDPITSIGGCQVTNIKDWNKCLSTSIREPSLGNCLPVSMITELDTSNKKKVDKGMVFHLKGRCILVLIEETLLYLYC